MLLKIVDTTDGKYIGRVINTSTVPIQLCKDVSFSPDKISQIDSDLWRLSNPSYVIDAKEP